VSTTRWFTAIAAALVLALAATGCAQKIGDGHAPDPGGDVTESFGKAVAGKLFGFSDSVFAYPDPGNPAQLGTAETVSDARATGANSTRLVFQWRLAEPSPGQWNTGYIAELQKVAKGFARPAVITLAFAPRWANEGTASKCLPGADCLYPPADDKLGDWQGFVLRALQSFPGAYIEVWNEPNLSTFWRPGIDVADYAKLVRSTWQVVRRERRAGRTKSKLLAGALAQVPNDGSRSALPWDFLADLYGKGLKGHYDEISWHASDYQEDNGVTPIGAGSPFARDFHEMRKVVKAHDPGTHFVITETGITRSGPGTELSEGDQKKHLVDVTRKMLGMRDVDGVFIHTLFTPAIYPPGTKENGFGLIEAPAAGKRAGTPAYCALVRQAHGRSSLCR
jgi:hypothetical protein